MAAEVRAVTARPGRRIPVIAVLMSAADREDARASAAPGAPPVYEYPEAAALALARVARYAAWRRTPPGRVPDLPGTNPEHAATLLTAAVARRVGLARRRRRWPPCSRATGSPWSRRAWPPAPREAGDAARDIGAPVALKAVAPGLVHKTDAGAVRLGLEGAEAVTEAARVLERRLEGLGHRVEGFLVQPLVSGGVEMLVGSSTDPHFGPVVVCGLGGTSAEVHHDIAIRLTPLTDLGARTMIRELRMLPLLQGYRGAPRL